MNNGEEKTSSSSVPSSTPPGLIGPADDETEREQQLARVLINSLFVLLRTAYIHSQNNAALIPPLETIQKISNIIFEHTGSNMFYLRLVSNTFFLNDTLVKLDQSSYQNANFLHVICEELGVGEIEFHDGCAEQEFRALMLTVIEAIRSGPDARGELRRDLGHIKLRKTPEMGSTKTLLDRRQYILRTYALILMFCNNTLETWPQGKQPRPSEIKRLTQNLLDIIEEDAVTLLGLTQLRTYRKYVANHFVNVAILSLIIGRAAGLGKPELVHLGMTAIMHELGVMDLPRQIIDRIDTLGEAENEEISRLPLLSIRRMTEFGSIGMQAVARMVTVFENRGHVPLTHTYRTQAEPDVMSQILAVADAYDHLTTSRMGHAALRPDQALEVMLLNREGKFADWAVKLLAAGIGRYPIGTLVELDTGERGIVFDRPLGNTPADRPRVRLISGPDGVALTGGIVVDLAEIDETGRPMRTIRHSLDPEQEQVNVPHFFMD